MTRLWLLCGRVLHRLMWPGLWLYLRWSSRTRVAILYEDEILVVKNWLGDGRYCLPGGGLHVNEAPVTGLLRELKEETGIELHDAELEHLSTENYQNDGARFECHYYAVRLKARPSTRCQQFEIVDIAWAKQSELSLKTHCPDVLRALELVESLDSGKPL